MLLNIAIYGSNLENNYLDLNSSFSPYHIIEPSFSYT